MPPKKSAGKPSSSNGVTINKELFKSRKFILSALAVALFVSLYTKIIQVSAVDNGFMVTYHSDRTDRALTALSEIKVTTQEQVDKVSN